MSDTNSLTEGLQHHELQGDHLRPQLKNDKVGPRAASPGVTIHSIQTNGWVMVNPTALANHEGSGKTLSSLTTCQLDARTNLSGHKIVRCSKSSRS